MKKYTFIIPARMESSRFYGKPLKKLNNQSIIKWVYENSLKSKYCKKAIIATDSIQIKKYCIDNNLNYKITGKHNCASNRVAEVALSLKEKWVVEIQGDEPLLFPHLINKFFNQISPALIKKSYDIFLSTAIIDSKESESFNTVKLIRNSRGEVTWFSRSQIPCNWKKIYNDKFFKHTGFHLWQSNSLIKFAKIKPSKIEKSEDTHAVRLIENDFKVKSIIINETQSIDTPHDLKKAKNILTKIPKNVLKKYVE